MNLEKHKNLHYLICILKTQKFTLTTKAEPENIFFKFKKLGNYLYGSKKNKPSFRIATESNVF